MVFNIFLLDFLYVNEFIMHDLILYSDYKHYSFAVTIRNTYLHISGILCFRVCFDSEESYEAQFIFKKIIMDA